MTRSSKLSSRALVVSKRDVVSFVAAAIALSCDACSSSSEAPRFTVPSLVDGGSASSEIPTSCHVDEDCPSVDAEPTGCAVGVCEDGSCLLRTRDLDGDGSRDAAPCFAFEGNVVLGEDCDDADATVFPGSITSCADVDGAPVAWPTGAPRGVCALGTHVCEGGAFGLCTGLVRPGDRDCDSADDNDCDGDADDTECDCEVFPSVEIRTCFDFAPPATPGVGPCRSGLQSCVANGAGKTTWGPCVGASGPHAADTCEAGNDDDCDGIPNEGCACIDGATKPCAEAGALGNCATGTATCWASTWVCSVAVEAHDACDVAGDDASCDGVPNEGCACVGPTCGKACATSDGACPGTWQAAATPKDVVCVADAGEVCSIAGGTIACDRAGFSGGSACSADCRTLGGCALASSVVVDLANAGTTTYGCGELETDETGHSFWTIDAGSPECPDAARFSIALPAGHYVATLAFGDVDGEDPACIDYAVADATGAFVGDVGMDCLEPGSTSRSLSFSVQDDGDVATVVVHYVHGGALVFESQTVSCASGACLAGAVPP